MNGVKNIEGDVMGLKTRGLRMENTWAFGIFVVVQLNILREFCFFNYKALDPTLLPDTPQASADFET